jgi:hypothetical protein
VSDRDLGRFARRYFTRIGAAFAMELPDYLEIDLPPEWHRWFDGRPRLAVALTREALADHPQAQLLTYGAPLLEQIAASLEAHGDLMLADYGDGGGPVEWPHVEDALATECGEPRHGAGWVASIWYRVALVADEVRERVATVVVPVGEVPQALADRVARAFLDGEDGAERPAAAVVPPRTGDAPAADALLGRARAALAVALSEEVAAFRSAKRAACEDEIARLRLHHDAQRTELERLTSDGARAQLAQLPEVMQRRIDEECEKYRVTVKAAPLAISLARVPLVHRRVRYESTARPGEAVEVDLTACPELSGPAEVACHACGRGSADPALCAGGHLVHRAACAVSCWGCGRRACRACLPRACATCGGSLCDACGAPCARCGVSGCAAHAAACPTCERRVCLTHLAPCRFCRAPACTACRGLDVPVARGTISGGEGECPACRNLTASSPGEAGTRQVVVIGRWLGGRIEVRDRASGQVLARRWVGPWVTWFDRRFR